MDPASQTRPVWERERALSELATRQHGVVAERQLLALGFTEQAIKGRLRAARLIHLHREVFAVGHGRVSRRGREWAAVLAYGPGALLSHESAAAFWGIGRTRGATVHVTAPLGRQGVRRRRGIWIHRCRLQPEDRAADASIPVTTVARTLFDLAEVADRGRLAHAWEEADRLGLLQLREVAVVCERGYGRRALRPIRHLLATARAPTPGRSPLEARFHRFLAEHGFPEPHVNVEVLGHEVDAYWPAARLIAELDGWHFHGHEAAFQRDRARDSARLAAGYRTVRVTHRRLDVEAGELATELRALLSVSS